MCYTPKVATNPAVIHLNLVSEVILISKWESTISLLFWSDTTNDLFSCK